MSCRPTCIAAACVSALCVLGTVVTAQSRFEALTQNAINEVPGLRVVIVRDNHMSACYTLFIMDPPSAPAADTVAAVPTPTDDATQQSIQRIREASEKRDRQLKELKLQFEKRTGRSYETWTTAPYIGNPDPMLVSQYESDRRKVDDEYEHVLRTEIPGSYPFAVLTPGLRTGGWEDAANAIRRATLDPDPTSTMKTMAGQFARIDEQLKRLIEAPRLAASGPVACSSLGVPRPLP